MLDSLSFIEKRINDIRCWKEKANQTDDFIFKSRLVETYPALHQSLRTILHGDIRPRGFLAGKLGSKCRRELSALKRIGTQVSESQRMNIVKGSILLDAFLFYPNREEDACLR